jgi:hypothetical protein
VTGPWITGTLDALSDEVGRLLEKSDDGTSETMNEGDRVNLVGNCDIGLIVGVTVVNGFTGLATGTGIDEGIDIEYVIDIEKDMEVECIKLSPRRRFHAAIFYDQTIECRHFKAYFLSTSDTYLEVNVSLFILKSKNLFKQV